MRIRDLVILVGFTLLGVIIGAKLERAVFLHYYEAAPNFPFVEPTPGYVLKGKCGQMPNYHVVLVPGHAWNFAPTTNANANTEMR